MVDDGDPVARLQKAQILDLLGTVGIHNNEQGFAVGSEHRLLSIYENVLILGRFHEHFDQGLRHGLFGVGNDVHPYAVFAGDYAHSDGSTDAVHIAESVTHDEHLRCVLDKRVKRIRHDSGLDLCSGVALADLATEEIEVEAVFDDRLVSAAAERHIACEHCKL